MQILVVAEQYPWPAVDGYRRRLEHMVRGLTQVGNVELLAVHPGGGVEPAPKGVTAEIVRVGETQSIRSWGPKWLTASPRSGPPRRVLSVDRSALRDAFIQRVVYQEPPALIWYSHIDTWWHLQGIAPGVASIVDLDNLENLALKLRRGIPPWFEPTDTILDRVKTLGRWTLSRGFDLVDEQRWDQAQQKASAETSAVVVCSDIDVQRSKCDNAVVISNGSIAPAAPRVDRKELVGEHPTMMFIGALDYEPNTEAVTWMVNQVMPLIRKQIPTAQLRIVGRGGDLVSWVDQHDGVTLVGEVEEVEPELMSTDISVVPIRVGAGTRLKVVEALAYHLPLVTTTVGCEGIAVEDNVHARITDTAEGFAQACVELLTSGEERQRLTTAGAQLFSEKYDWEIIETQVAELATSVIATTDAR